jgi:hypothetical protein
VLKRYPEEHRNGLIVNFYPQDLIYNDVTNSSYKLNNPVNSFCIGPLIYLACDIGSDYKFCPTGGLQERSCIVNIVVTGYMDIVAVGMQIIMLLLLAGAQGNLMEKIHSLEAREKRMPEDFQQIINYYHAIQVFNFHRF